MADRIPYPGFSLAPLRPSRQPAVRGLRRLSHDRPSRRPRRPSRRRQGSPGSPAYPTRSTTGSFCPTARFAGSPAAAPRFSATTGRRYGWSASISISPQSKESEAQIRLLNEGLEQRVRERTAELGQQVRLINMARDAIMVPLPGRRDHLLERGGGAALRMDQGRGPGTRLPRDPEDAISASDGGDRRRAGEARIVGRRADPREPGRSTDRGREPMGARSRPLGRRGGSRNQQRHHRAQGVRGGAASRPRRGPGGHAGQGRVPGEHEPRDPHADERRHRHDRLAAGYAAQRPPAQLRRDHPLAAARRC